MTLEPMPVETIHETPPVELVVAPNAGPKTLDGTHTYVVGSAGRYLIDPGPADALHLRRLADLLQVRGSPLAGILLTHGHPDHAPGAAQLAALTGAPILAAPNLDVSYFSSQPEFRPLRDGDELAIDGDRLRVVATPGHSADHLAFFLVDARLLFVGDTLLGYGSTLVAPPEGDMSQYLATLDRLEALEPLRIAPGHGPLIRDPIERIRAYRTHRLEREAEILAVLEQQCLAVEEIVRQVYLDLDPALLELAAGSVMAHLIKLCQDGRVQEVGGGFTGTAPGRQG